MPRLILNIKRIISTVILIYFSLSIHAQVYQFRNFGFEEGLPHRFVYTINQDRSGYLWLGTGTDLARFNGLHFESNPTGDSLPTDFVIRSFYDSEERLWFGHNSGSISVLENGRIRIVDNKGLRTRITGIVEDSEGNILFSSQQHGLLVVDREGNRVIHSEYFESYQITALAIEVDGNLLIGTFEGLYSYSYSPGEEPVMIEKITAIPDVTISGIHSPDDRGIFVGTRDQGIFHLKRDPDNRYTSTNMSEDLGFGHVNVESLFVDGKGDIWISTRGQGVYRIAGYYTGSVNSEVMNFTTLNGLAADFVYSVFQDLEGNYWFATFNGLSMLVDEAFSFYRTFDEPFGSNVLAVYSNNHYIWLGGESGLLRMSRENPENRMFYGTARGLPFDMVTAIASCDDNNIWIGTSSNGIYKLGRTQQSAVSFHLSPNSLENAVHDLNYNDGILRAATSNGVIEFNLQTGERNRYSTDDGLPRNFIRSIYRDTNGINWIATRSNRIVDIEGKREISIGYELDFVSFDQDIKGRFWAATNGSGILKIANDTIVQFTSEEGLHSNFCYSLLTDSKGNIWVGHRLGLSRVDTDTYLVRTYGAESAIRGDFNFNSSHITSDGILLFGTTEGLVSFDPDKERALQSPPMMNITSLQISDEEYEITEKISLPYGSYKFRIEFIGLHYSFPERVQYQYKLKGYDLDWSVLSEYRFAYYPRLDDGNYEFLLRAYNAEGITAEVPLSLLISIDTPLWKKWYFFLFVIAFGVALFFMIVKIRERNLKLEKERIERELAIRTKEVIEQKVEIEHKNRDITDSINYAQRIQASILPPISKIDDNFSESFVFFQPRDIVSGDFYWFDRVNETKFLVVCADSTGHGVPGAFMSMIGTTLIKDICMRPDVNSPSEVLKTLDIEITSTLNQNIDKSGKSTDGMDITVCEFDTKTRYLRFASAMRPIILLHKGELSYVRGSRNSIGGYYTQDKTFENQGYQLNKGDIIYLFSDGYPDQFGGSMGKKFKMVRLKNLLADICNKPLNEQYEHLKNNFNTWKGDQDQVDDVLFMGIKV